MNKPTLSKSGGLYRLEWAAEHVTIEVDRISEHGDEIRGQLTVVSTTNCDPRILSQFSYNFGSLAARDKAARHLAEYLNLEWKPLLEMASYEVLKHIRQGEPPVMVGAQPITEDAYRLYPFLQEGEPNMLYGRGGSGKTTFAVMCALLVTTGETRYGLQTEGGNVAWFDFEWNSRPVNNIAAKLNDGLGLSCDTEFTYRRCYLPLVHDLTAIQRIVLETGAKLIIVDSLGAALGDDPQQPAAVLKYFMALRSLGVTSLTIDHTAKENTGPFGSVYKINSSRNIWEAMKGTATGENSMALGLHHRKVNSGPLLKSWGFQFEYQPGSIIPKPCDIRSIPDIVAGMSLVDQMQVALSRGKMTPAELGQELNRTAAVISTTLSRYKERFVSCGSGKWGNKADEPNNEANS